MVEGLRNMRTWDVNPASPGQLYYFAQRHHAIHEGHGHMRTQSLAASRTRCGCYLQVVVQLHSAQSSPSGGRRQRWGLFRCGLNTKREAFPRLVYIDGAYLVLRFKPVGG